MASIKQTRYAVVSVRTLKTLKNAETREEARKWKRNAEKSGLGIMDRQLGRLVS